MRLLPTEFKPPRTHVVQACSPNIGHDGSADQELLSSQRLLDGDEVTSNRPHTDLLK